jgi:16S rRNA (adenine1518-N6/adenine1519-N6)-dimethyltransferase
MRPHYPRRRFGQTFLRDETVVHALIDAINPRSDDCIVEIGPGQGALTEALAAACGQLHLVEIDRDLFQGLEQRFGAQSRVFLHLADALKFDFRRIEASGSPLRIVGNLPYNISTPLLFHLFDQADQVADMHFMLQREVVDRLTATPGSADYGRLSVMSQYHCWAESLFEVFPESFFPQPKVMSAVVRLIPHRERPVDTSLSALQEVVMAAFGQRRKTLRNSLQRHFTSDELARQGIDGGLRAQDLTLDDFARLASALDEGSKQ